MTGLVMPSETVGPAFGITVDEALGLPCLAGAGLVAGARGRGHRIRVVNIMEDPDIVRWMRGGELLLTTAYPVRGDPGALTALVTRLAERGLAALGVKIGPYLQSAPAEMLAEADRLAFPVVEIPGDVIFNDVLSEVLGTILNRQAVELERSEAIHERLTAVSLAGGSHGELIGALAELLRMPAAILDPRGHVLVSAGPLSPGSGLPVVTRPIQAGDTLHGDVAVWTRDDLLPHQLMAIEHAATIAAMAMAQERAVVSREQRHRALLLMELVSSWPVERAEMARRAAAMGWDLDCPRAAVLVELHGPAGPLRIAGSPLEDRLVHLVQAAVGPRSIVWGLDSGLAMLVEPERPLHQTCQDVHTRLTQAQPQMQVMVACGRVYTDFSNFRRSYEEAGETLALGRELYGDDFVLRHDELGIYRLLCQLPLAELRRHVEEALGPLLEYDAARHGSLVRTLECYLRNNRNRVAASTELNVHYNTLRYRLEQIDGLVGGIDRDPTRRLQIEVAVHAGRLLTARSASATGDGSACAP